MSTSDREIADGVENLVSRLFSVGRSEVTSITREMEPKWTSLMHVELFFALEEQFNIRISEDEMAFAESVADLIEVVRRSKIANQ